MSWPAGFVNNNGLDNTGSNGYYWSSTINNANNAYNLNFNSNNINPANNDRRLVDVSVLCPPIPIL